MQNPGIPYSDIEPIPVIPVGYREALVIGRRLFANSCEAVCLGSSLYSPWRCRNPPNAQVSLGR
jgi:hypothetical protein